MRSRIDDHRAMNSSEARRGEPRFDQLERAADEMDSISPVQLGDSCPPPRSTRSPGVAPVETGPLP